MNLDRLLSIGARVSQLIVGISCLVKALSLGSGSDLCLLYCAAAMILFGLATRTSKGFRV